MTNKEYLFNNRKKFNYAKIETLIFDKNNFYNDFVKTIDNVFLIWLNQKNNKLKKKSSYYRKIENKLKHNSMGYKIAFQVWLNSEYISNNFI